MDAGAAADLIADNVWRFTGPTVQVVVTSPGQKVLVTANQAFGTDATPALDLDLAIGFVLPPSTTINVDAGGGMWDLRIPGTMRLSMGSTAVFTGLAPGTYEFGLIYKTGSPNWTNNEWGYITAMLLN